MKKNILSLLLILCLIVGLLPTTAFAATSKTLTLNYTTTSNPVLWEEFVNEFSGAGTGDIITIDVVGKVNLPAPLKNENGASFYIKGSNGATIGPSIDSEADKAKFQNTHLFTFKNGTDTSFIDVKDLTLDGGETTGLISVSKYGYVRLGSDNNGPRRQGDG